MESARRAKVEPAGETPEREETRQICVRNATFANVLGHRRQQKKRRDKEAERVHSGENQF